MSEVCFNDDLQKAITNIDKPVEAKEESSHPLDWRTALKEMKEKMTPLLTFTAILSDGKEVQYRSTNTQDMKRLLMLGPISDPRIIEDAFDILINSVVKTPGFNIDNVLAYDRIKLLMLIRINSKGGNLESSYTCESCGNQVIFNQNIKEFEEVEKPKEYEREIKISDNFSLIVDYNTRRDQKEMFKFATAKKEELLQTEINILNVAALIKGIRLDGVEHVFPDFTYKDRYQTFMDLPEHVLDTLIEWDRKNEFGIKMVYNRVCPHCGNTEKIEITTNSLF